MHELQNTCPHVVVTTCAPLFSNMLENSMQTGHLILPQWGLDSSCIELCACVDINGVIIMMLYMSSLQAYPSGECSIIWTSSAESSDSSTTTISSPLRRLLLLLHLVPAQEEGGVKCQVSSEHTSSLMCLVTYPSSSSDWSNCRILGKTEIIMSMNFFIHNGHACACIGARELANCAGNSLVR